MSSAETALNHLLTIMQKLRDPEQGCAWDRAQTFASLTPYTLEECYEVLDAIERGNSDDLRDELGDLLYQIVFYSQIAKEQQRFDFGAVCEAISDKLVRRHPHLFGDTPTVTTAPQTAQWEKIKQQERRSKQQLALLDDIPQAMPALMRADKIQRRCQSVGFDWDSLGPVVDKVREELDEVLEEATMTVVDPQRLEEELGDLLFATVNLTRHLGSQAELALQKANAKFSLRFRQVQAMIEQQGLSLEQATLEQMEQAWQQIKRQE